ncbi:hypothetical protein [Lysinibacillus xylanilyticus]|uniref:hypothetical protein n=1 Tax=Lysinibacillus xylanilyticus TaxID=582475 RepID=UPI003D00E0E9
MDADKTSQSVLLDVYQRLGGIEAKIDDVKSIRVTADDAKSTAQRAEQKSDANGVDIKEIRSEIADSRKESANNKRWLIGTIITTALTVVGLAISILN